MGSLFLRFGRHGRSRRKGLCRRPRGKCVWAIKKKAENRGCRIIEAHESTAADLSFIKDRTVDLVFANGLLCSMAADRPAAVAEIKRVLKPGGRAYLSPGAAPPWGYIDRAEWSRILAGFRVDEGGVYEKRRALVTPICPEEERP
jgi:SAM-dependent methyltransferase